MSAPTPLSAAAAALWLVTAAPSQVLISEINFTAQVVGDDEWIELYNPTANTVDISTWSLYFATKTAGQANNYWFGFRPQTLIPPGGFVTVHWMAPNPQNSTTTDIITGDQVYNFLFGYLPEKLNGNISAGAVALLNTQNNLLMNSSAIIRDWVTWGSGWTSTVRPRRENLAITAGRWLQLEAALQPPGRESIALNYGAQAEPTPASAFFRDFTPTEGVHNHRNAEFSVLESAPGVPRSPCTFGGGTAPTVSAISVPTSGNIDFALSIGNLVPQQATVLFLDVTTISLPIFGCEIVVAPTVAVGGPPTPGSPWVLPVSLQQIPTATLYIQALQISAVPVAVGFDPGHKWVIGQ